VALGLVAAPEVVAAIAARMSPRAATAASTTGTAAARAAEKLFQPEEVEVLRRFFGQGLEGARAAIQNFKIPQGITPDLLLRYKVVAEAAIAAGKDQRGVQVLRLELIKRALEDMAKK
jgi:hypothetical protein